VRSEDSQNFSEHPYIGRIARSSVRQLSCLVLQCNKISSIGKWRWKLLQRLPHIMTQIWCRPT